ncbi:DUF4344 domain-containing metallopeptidase [Nonomuraea sp. bgisy101]|uniref:DUF4344 domain-containing metallopeptidase n=1 Tax=Nonomuraea sp. bgisy101 TaxID=3413784 RepID=UPI003D753195
MLFDVPPVHFERSAHPAAERMLREVIPSRLPGGLALVAKDCGKPEARWDHERRRIVYCYELATTTDATMKGIAETEESGDPAATTAGALTAVLHQQMGHALIALNGLEASDALADRFAALTLASAAPRRVVAAAHGHYLTVAGRPERSFDFECLLYGADPKAHARIASAGWVPAERAPGCVREYGQARESLGSYLR